MNVSEAELAAAAVAPRVTLEQLEATIASEHYFTAADGVDGAAIDAYRAQNPTLSLRISPVARDKQTAGTPYADLALLTFCVLRLQNGFTTHGVSACADPANFNREIGQRLARADAVNKIWPLLGYELKTKLALQSQLAQGAGQAECANAEPQASAAGSTEGAGPATTFVDRLIIEHDELERRLDKLSLFLAGHDFQRLDLLGQRDLLDQARHMEGYLTILKRRLAANGY